MADRAALTAHSVANPDPARRSKGRSRCATAPRRAAHRGIAQFSRAPDALMLRAGDHLRERVPLHPIGERSIWRYVSNRAISRLSCLPQTFSMCDDADCM